MEFENPNTVALVSAGIAALALIWAVYSHMSTRKVSKLTYELTELADFGVPAEFLCGITHSPVVLTITSRGNAATENIVLNLETTTLIEECDVRPKSAVVSWTERELSLSANKLNPSQQIVVSLKCDGNPAQSQVCSLKLSHSGGAGLPKTDAAFSIELLGIELQYDPVNLATKLVSIGPISFR
ncbi:MAG: hypothetical protein AAF515_22270 [Pseudomonadota bacterium]